VRTYEQTHPFLKFSADLRKAPPLLWILLGEAQSKCEHISGVPLPAPVQQELQTVYLAKGLLATTAIEGNTLSEAEVRQLLEGTLKLPPSKEYLKTEIDNILEVCNRIFEDEDTAATLTPQRIKGFNAAVLKGLQLEEGVIPGEIRKYSVGVPGYRGAPVEDCEYLIGRLCEWLNGKDFEPAAGMPVAFAILKAVIAHLYLAWIHPFGDGNGRTARLMEFFILVQAGVPMAAAHLLSNHYNLTRSEYYRQLAEASKSGGELVPLLTYAIRGLVDGLREQLRVVREAQLRLAWGDYVRERFSGLTSKAAIRRQLLVHALSDSDWVPRADITRLDPDVAAAYATKTGKTLSRDLNILKRMRLIDVERDQVRVKRNRMLAFRSKTKDPKVIKEIREALAEPVPRRPRRRRDRTALQPTLPLA
jgi:Fic family protein